MIRARVRMFVTAVFATLLAGLGPAVAEGFEGTPWISTHQSDHPLVGTIWATAPTRAISRAELNDALVRADFVALGEIHDNPDHHRLQADLIAMLADHGRAPTITFEMVPREMDRRLRDFIAGNPTDASGLGALLEWKKRGWPDWEIYRPIAEVALRNGLEMRAGGLSRSQTRAIAKDETGPALDAIRRAWNLAAPLPAKKEHALVAELYESHCQLMPKSALGRMVRVQRARDAAMAGGLTRGPETSIAVLIAGAGHVRNDWAVPALIRDRFPAKSVISVALIEAEAGRSDAADYLPASADGRPVFDYLIFTPRYSVADHCAELRKKMKR